MEINKDILEVYIGSIYWKHILEVYIALSYKIMSTKRFQVFYLLLVLLVVNLFHFYFQDYS